VITRRTFLHKSLLYGTTGVAAGLWFPLLNTIDMAFAQGGQSFNCVISIRTSIRRTSTALCREGAGVTGSAAESAADFIFGGDMAQLGDPVELRVGAGC
jgi:hypothetical protein